MVGDIGVEASPKGVADMDMTMETVVEKIRDRREAVLEGRVKPSTIPKFPSPPVRRSLISTDDEEFKTYRIEITTDNVVQQPVPARFSQSGAEEYLAEFDMVDTQGEFVSPQTTKVAAAAPPAPPALNLKQRKSGRFSPFPFRSGSKDSSSLKEPKKSEKSADGMPMPPRAEKKTGGPLSSLRKRTLSSEGPKVRVEANAPSPSQVSTPPRGEKEFVEDNLHTPPSRETNISVPAKTPLQGTDTESSTPQQAHNKTEDVTPPPSQTRRMFSALRKRRDSPQRGRQKSPESGKPTLPQDKNPMYAEPSTEWDGMSESSREKKKGDAESTPAAAKEQAPVQVPTESSTTVEVEDETPGVDAAKAATETTMSKPTEPKEDDTESMTISSNGSPVIKPPTKFPGEAVVEGLLEKFFDKVTCSCINDKCVAKDEKEVPEYMVVEIQKIHQKAQAKKAEMAERKLARRSSRSTGKPSSSLSKNSVSSKNSAKKKDKSAKNKVTSTSEQKPSSPERQGVLTYEWGEKVLEQDSVTTASSHPQLSPGITVGEFLQKRFGMFEVKSLPREEEEPAAGEGQGADVDESEPKKDPAEVTVDGAILNITSVNDRVATKSAPLNGAVEKFAAKGGERKVPKETVIVLSAADEIDGSESLLDAVDDGDSLLNDEDESEYTTEVIQVEFDPSKLGNTTDADMYLAREVLRRYAEITGISLDELIEDVVDESLASLTLDAHGFPTDHVEDESARSGAVSF